jgi:hypothetical protein
MASKVGIPGKVQKDSGNRKKFAVKKDKESEHDITIEIEEDGEYEVEKLSVEGLPDKIDGISIRWINNFAIKKKGGSYIKQRFFVTLPYGGENAKIVIHDSKGLHYYDGEVKKVNNNNQIILTDGDPATGYAP